MLLWILGIAVGFILISIIIVRANRRTAMRAYLQGVSDARTLSWDEVVTKYKSFLKPLRPIDAASYKRGLEYALNSKSPDWRLMKAMFTDAYKSGDLAREGTTIRRQGAACAADSFKLDIRPELAKVILGETKLSLLESRIEFEEFGNKQSA